MDLVYFAAGFALGFGAAAAWLSWLNHQSTCWLLDRYQDALEEIERRGGGTIKRCERPSTIHLHGSN
jgi:hypothetical protein